MSIESGQRVVYRSPDGTERRGTVIDAAASYPLVHLDDNGPGWNTYLPAARVHPILPTQPTDQEVTMSTTPKFPEIEVTLSDTDSNAFAVMGVVAKALKKGEREGLCDPGTADEFRTEAMSGDYDHLLRTCMAYVEVS